MSNARLRGASLRSWTLTEGSLSPEMLLEIPESVRWIFTRVHEAPRRARGIIPSSNQRYILSFVRARLQTWCVTPNSWNYSDVVAMKPFKMQQCAAWRNHAPNLMLTSVAVQSIMKFEGFGVAHQSDYAALLSR